MSSPFLGEVRVFSFNFAPRGWALCNGQLLPINQNQPLFALLGTTYGGNGSSTFALPNMQGRSPVYVGQGIVQGEMAGSETHVLSVLEMPAHNHPAKASNDAPTVPSPTDAYWANGLNQIYSATDGSTMDPAAVGTAGSSQGHENMAPFLPLNFSIALQGIFPPRN